MFRSWRVFLGVLVLAVASAFGVAALAQDQDQGDSPAAEQPASNRIALVIGNADYQADALPTTANDAGLVAQTLTQAGFDVTAMGNTDGDTLRKTLKDFLEKVRSAGPDATTFVYLSGYGVQYEGDNFFVPIDATLARDTDVPIEAVRLSDFARAIESTPAKGHLFVYDLARENSFAKGGTALAGGLAQVQAPDGSLYAFNAGPGTVAVPDAAPYGFYAKALSEMIQSPGLPMDQLFDQVRLRVSELTNGGVIPWDDNKLGVDFTFFPPVEGQAPPPAPDTTAAIASLPAPQAYTAAVSRDRLEDYQSFVQAYPKDRLAKRVRTIIAARRESLTWGQSYGANSARAYWSYMRRYPRGPHFADARRRLALLREPLEPPSRFEPYDYRDLPPPPQDEYGYIDRPYVSFADPDYGPIPPPPIEYLPPPRLAFYDELPPPPIVPIGFLPIPAPIPLPFVYDRPRFRDRYYAPGYIAQPFVPGYGVVIARNRFEPGGGSVVTLMSRSNNTVISRTTTTIVRGNREIVQTGANNAIISRTVTSRESGRFQAIQTGANGNVLSRTVTERGADGGRNTIVTNGNNQVISNIQRNNNGVTTQVKRGAFQPMRPEPNAFAPGDQSGRGSGANGPRPDRAGGPKETDTTRGAGNALPKPGDANRPGFTPNESNRTPQDRNTVPRPKNEPGETTRRPNAPDAAPGRNALPKPGETERPEGAPRQKGGPSAAPDRTEQPTGRPNQPGKGKEPNVPNRNALPKPGNDNTPDTGTKPGVNPDRPKAPDTAPERKGAGKPGKDDRPARAPKGGAEDRPDTRPDTKERGPKTVPPRTNTRDDEGPRTKGPGASKPVEPREPSFNKQPKTPREPPQQQERAPRETPRVAPREVPNARETAPRETPRVREAPARTERPAAPIQRDVAPRSVGGGGPEGGMRAPGGGGPAMRPPGGAGAPGGGGGAMRGPGGGGFGGGGAPGGPGGGGGGRPGSGGPGGGGGGPGGGRF